MTTKSQASRIQAVQAELDRCWDLLRQCREVRRFGEDPDPANVQQADDVEKYEQETLR
jgi:hypothetical protein